MSVCSFIYLSTFRHPSKILSLSFSCHPNINHTSIQRCIDQCAMLSSRHLQFREIAISSEDRVSCWKKAIMSSSVLICPLRDPFSKNKTMISLRQEINTRMYTWPSLCALCSKQVYRQYAPTSFLFNHRTEITLKTHAHARMHTHARKHTHESLSLPFV